VELGEREAEGTYANLALISHTPAEFVLDFARLLPGSPKTRVQSRIIMAPQNAKRLLSALRDNIQKYEDRHGPIPELDTSSSHKDIGFKAR
jgi:hypothetical protein